LDGALFESSALRLRHDLPLQYGGFREKTLKDLYILDDTGLSSPRKALIT